MTNEEDNKFVKTSSGASFGTMYHVKMLATFLLRGNDNQFQFKIAAEMAQKEVGKFDDVILTYTKTNRKHSILIQAKHLLFDEKDNKSKIKITLRTLTSCDENKFMLAKYLYTYVNYVRNNSQLGIIDNVILFTNCQVDKEIEKLTDVVEDISYMLYEENTSKYFYTFKLNEAKIKDAKIKTKRNRFKAELLNAVCVYHCKTFVDNLLSNFLYRNTFELSKGQCMTFSNIEARLVDNMFKFTIDNVTNAKILIGIKEQFIEVSNIANCDKYMNTFHSIMNSEIGKLSEKFAKKMTETFERFDFNNRKLSLKDLDRIISFIKPQANFIIDKSNLQALDKVFTDDLLEEFLNSFILAANQPNVYQLDEIIENLLKKHCFFKELPVKFAKNDLIVKLTKWLDDAEGIFLDKDYCESLLTNIYIKQDSTQHLWNMNSLKVSFGDVHLEYLHNEVVKSSILNISTSCDPKLIIVKLYQALHNKGSYVLMEYGKFVQLEFTKRIIEEIDGIILNCAYWRNINVEEFIMKIKQMYSQITILFITQDKQVKLKKILASSFDFSIPTLVHNASFKQLSKISKEKIIKQRVHFLGEDWQFGELFGVDTDNLDEYCMDNKILCKFMHRDKLVISKMFERAYESKAAYSNFIGQRIEIDRLVAIILKKEHAFAFAISGYESVSETEEYFIKLCNDRTDITDRLHCLNTESNNGCIFDVIENSDPFAKMTSFEKHCESSKLITFWMEIDNITLYVRQSYNPFFYIERKLKYVKNVKIFIGDIVKILKERNNTKFIIANLSNNDSLRNLLFFYSTNDIQQWIHTSKTLIISNTDGNSEFLDECENAKPREEVHLLKYLNGELFWVKSHGSLDLIRKSQKVVNVYNEEEFLSKVNSRLVILSGEAGIGKSTTLTYLSQQKTLSKWVIRIDFRKRRVQECLAILSKYRLDIGIISKFICNINTEQDENTTITLLNESSLSNTANSKIIFIIFDGLDEVPPGVHNITKNLIKWLMERTRCEVFLTSREDGVKEIEDEYSIISTKFQEISADEQYKLLVNNWFPKLVLFSDNFDRIKLLNIAKSLIKRIVSGIEIDSSFTGNPLYLKLISDLSLDYVKEDNIHEFLVSNLDKFSLIKRFLQNNIEVYFRDKKSTLIDSIECKVFTEKCHEIFSKFAFQYLFPDYMSEDVASIIGQYTVAGTIQPYQDGYEFIYRIFLEYYCACYFVNCLRDNDNAKITKLIESVLEIVAKNKRFYNKIINLMDCLLVEELPLHRAIFNGNTNCFENFINEFNHLNGQDAMGKTPLHYAVQYKRDEMVKSLLKANVNCFLSDICKQTPLHYAFRYDEEISPFLQFHVSIDVNLLLTLYNQENYLSDLFNLKDNLGNTCFDYMAERELWQQITILIEHGIHANKMSQQQKYKILKYIFQQDDASTILQSAAFRFIFDNIELLQEMNQDYFEMLLSFLCKNLGQNNYNFHLFNLITNSEISIKDTVDNYLSHFNKSLFGDIDYLIIIKTLLENNFLKNISTKNLYIMILEKFLMFASCKGYLEIFKFIINTNHLSPQYTLEKYFKLISLDRCMVALIQNNQQKIMRCVWEKYDRDVSPFFENQSVLHLSVNQGILPMVQLLCDLYVDVNPRNARNQTPLHLARNLDLLKCIQDKGGDINAEDIKNFTLLDYCLCQSYHYIDENKQKDLLKLIEYLIFDLKAKSKKLDVFTKNNESQFEEIIQLILHASHESVNDPYDYTTLLHKAVELNALFFIEFLLSLGANPLATNSNGQRPVEYSDDLIVMCALKIKQNIKS